MSGLRLTYEYDASETVRLAFDAGKLHDGRVESQSRRSCNHRMNRARIPVKVKNGEVDNNVSSRTRRENK